MLERPFVTETNGYNQNNGYNQKTANSERPRIPTHFPESKHRRLHRQRFHDLLPATKISAARP